MIQWVVQVRGCWWCVVVDVVGDVWCQQGDLVDVVVDGDFGQDVGGENCVSVCLVGVDGCDVGVGIGDGYCFQVVEEGCVCVVVDGYGDGVCREFFGFDCVVVGWQVGYVVFVVCIGGYGMCDICCVGQCYYCVGRYCIVDVIGCVLGYYDVCQVYICSYCEEGFGLFNVFFYKCFIEIMNGLIIDVRCVLLGLL